MIARDHILIEKVFPSVGHGRYPAKTIVGDDCAVEADVFRDGHDPLQVTLRWRFEGGTWNEALMSDDGNDRWRASFHVDRIGLYEFKIAAVTKSDPTQSDSIETQIFRVIADRPLARFGNWYALFPRSQGTDPHKSGTFDDVVRRLPDIQTMGFNVIYLTPIHPIGRTARKGPDNAPKAGPNDPGSPWAIGNENGGHDAIEPSIGTLDGFDRLIKAARVAGIDIALDFAPHCSPDHPWVKQHPEWFYHRPDGTIKCHENPPYVYEDVYPLNFDCKSQNELFDALLNVFLFWAKRGVTIFRIDNPHTKPLFFWEWAIAEVKKKYPEAIFLGEAFTKPKMMKALSKAGFSQSYTYFIWRTTKLELTEYLTELADPLLQQYFRPNFFPTTPDVLPPQLQNAGPTMFKLRAALAATLAPSWGIISGYELCENQAIAGTQEYGDSEKYRIKVRDWNRPGHIKDTLAKLNHIRNAHPALQLLSGLRFVETSNDQLLVFIRSTADKSDCLVVAANLDPSNAQEARFQLPLDKMGLSWEAQFTVQDLMTQQTHRWNKNAFIRIDPPQEPFQIFLVKR